MSVSISTAPVPGLLQAVFHPMYTWDSTNGFQARLDTSLNGNVTVGDSTTNYTFSINGIPLALSANVAAWSTYPAVSDVSLAGYNIVSSSNININSSAGTGNVNISGTFSINGQPVSTGAGVSTISSAITGIEFSTSTGNPVLAITGGIDFSQQILSNIYGITLSGGDSLFANNAGGLWLCNYPLYMSNSFIEMGELTTTNKVLMEFSQGAFTISSDASAFLVQTASNITISSANANLDGNQLLLGASGNQLLLQMATGGNPGGYIRTTSDGQLLNIGAGPNNANAIQVVSNKVRLGGYTANPNINEIEIYGHGVVISAEIDFNLTNTSSYPVTVAYDLSVNGSISCASSSLYIGSNGIKISEPSTGVLSLSATSINISAGSFTICGVPYSGGGVSAGVSTVSSGIGGLTFSPSSGNAVLSVTGTVDLGSNSLSNVSNIKMTYQPTISLYQATNGQYGVLDLSGATISSNIVSVASLSGYNILEAFITDGVTCNSTGSPQTGGIFLMNVSDPSDLVNMSNGNGFPLRSLADWQVNQLDNTTVYWNTGSFVAGSGFNGPSRLFRYPTTGCVNLFYFSTAGLPLYDLSMVLRGVI